MRADRGRGAAAAPDPIDPAAVSEVAARWREGGKAAAFTGAGISVESGIPDFRSREGVWARYPLEKYGLLASFLANPARSWTFFRAVREAARDAAPGPGHRILAELEAEGLLAGVVTQNVDGLHQRAGSRRVVEIHGSERELNCPRCRCVTPTPPLAFAGGAIPACPQCGSPMKPRAVLFGEPILAWEEALALVDEVPLLLVVGTSALVEPAASLPSRVLERGGAVVEVNPNETALSGRATRVVRAGAGRGLAAIAEALRR